MDAVKSVLSAAKMKKTDIHEILLVGGSTRIPKVQTMLQDFFNGRRLNRSVNADEAVAYGATLLAAKLTGTMTKSMQRLRLLDKSGILHVSVVEKSLRKQKSITTINYKGGLSEEEIERMMNDAEKFKQVDEKERRRLAAKNGLVGHIYSIREEMESEGMKQRTSEENRQKAIRTCEKMMNWINKEKNAKEEDYKRMWRTLEEMYTDITRIRRSAVSDHSDMKSDIDRCGHPNTRICIVEYNKKRRI
ncbi:Heat shock cognate protein [Echinococcus granulosus]|nr:Heat shock cognate protein [Echinococcus granulosus]EUB54651.1 Heat shock cognate protein [Echinococcus granulosus]